MGQYIYLIVGESGSGKSWIVDRLIASGMTAIQSYTTRSPRYPGETGHIFVDKMPEDMANFVAYTHFDGNDYWATTQQVEENDLYVVDPAGVAYFLRHYTGTKEPVVFYIETTEKTRRKRMKRRGDKRKDIRRRIRHDRIMFGDPVYDCLTYIIPNDDGLGVFKITDTIRQLEAKDGEEPVENPV